MFHYILLAVALIGFLSFYTWVYFRREKTPEKFEKMHVQVLQAKEMDDGCVLPEQVKYQLPIGSNQLIGMIYPPRAGPLHVNFQLPDKNRPCQYDHADIYEDGVVFNKCVPSL